MRKSQAKLQSDLREVNSDLQAKDKRIASLTEKLSQAEEKHNGQPHNGDISGDDSLKLKKVQEEKQQLEKEIQSVRKDCDTWV